MTENLTKVSLGHLGTARSSRYDKVSWHWEGLKSVSKGQCHEFFCFWFSSWISFPPALEYSMKTISNFFENWRRYLQFKVHHRYQRHQWQTLTPAAKLPPVSTTPAANLPPVSMTPAANFYTSLASVVDTGGKQREQLSNCWQLKMNLKKMYLYANSTIQRCPKEIIKIFLIEDFFHLPTGINNTSGKPWAANIFANFRKYSKRP